MLRHSFFFFLLTKSSHPPFIVFNHARFGMNDLRAAAGEQFCGERNQRGGRGRRDRPQHRHRGSSCWERCDRVIEKRREHLERRRNVESSEPVARESRGVERRERRRSIVVAQGADDVGEGSGAPAAGAD